MEFLDFPDMFKQINLIVIIKTFMEPLMWLSLAIHYEDAPRFSGSQPWMGRIHSIIFRRIH